MEEQPARPDMAQGSSSSDWEATEAGRSFTLEDSDDNLTSLLWLKDFSLANTSLAKSSCCLGGPDPPSSQRCSTLAAPCSALAAEPTCGALSHSPCQPISSSASRTVLSPELAQDTGHRSNPSVRPPYTYASLICMAMEASQKPSISLSAIYKWIRDNFSYFRHAEPNLDCKTILHTNLNSNCDWETSLNSNPRADVNGETSFETKLSTDLDWEAILNTILSDDFPTLVDPELTPPSSSTEHDSDLLLKEHHVDHLQGGQEQVLTDSCLNNPSRLCSPALLSQEQQPGLGSLTGDFDLEATFNTNSCGNFDTTLSRDVTFRQWSMPPAHSHTACPTTALQGTGSLTGKDTSSGTYTSILSVNREVQHLLEDFEQATSNESLTAAGGKAGQKRKKASPAGMAKVARLCSPALLSQEQQPELGALQGDLDWEAFFYSNQRDDLDRETSFNITLTEPNSPAEHEPELMAHGHHIHQLQDGQEQEQLLTEASVNNLDFDETFMATYFLQQELDKETNDCLYY
ncbi:forkhead box protein J1-B-like [Colius striatus]|uniref:forkhead box protein J1-B-like n=1 Tax=Colius striatus TaxID=57412 RepID=UPI002B1D0215|nr:forkhead box protein J1-B-like [Colius striatus]